MCFFLFKINDSNIRTAFASLLLYKHMYIYVRHVVSAIQKSYVDQVLSRKRPIIGRDEVHHSVWCLLDVLLLALLFQLCRGRPRPCSRRLPARGAVFVFWSKYLEFIFARICLLYTSPSPRDRQKSRMPSSA